LSRLDDLVSLSQLTQWLNPHEGRESKTENRGLRKQDGGTRIENRGTTIEDERHFRSEVQIPPSSILDPPSSSILDPPTSVPDVQSSNGAKELTEATLGEMWPGIMSQLGPMLAGNLNKSERVAISGPKTLVLTFPPRYNHERDYCQEATRVARIQDVLRKVTGQSRNIRVEAVSGEDVVPLRNADPIERATSSYRRQRAEAGQEPLVKRAMDQLGAQIVHVDDGFGVGTAESPEQLEKAIIEET
jgi:hypothetical protein